MTLKKGKHLLETSSRTGNLKPIVNTLNGLDKLVEVWSSSDAYGEPTLRYTITDKAKPKGYIYKEMVVDTLHEFNLKKDAFNVDLDVIMIVDFKTGKLSFLVGYVAKED